MNRHGVRWFTVRVDTNEVQKKTYFVQSRISRTATHLKNVRNDVIPEIRHFRSRILIFRGEIQITIVLQKRHLVNIHDNAFC